MSAARRERIYPDTGQVALRALVLAGAMAALVAAVGAGARPPLWVELVLLALAVLTALRPESAGGVALLLGSAYVWAVAPRPLSAWVLLAAAGLVLVHVSALVAAQGPARMRVDGVQLWLWARRAVLLWLVAAVVWLVTLLVQDQPEHRAAYAVGLGLLVVLAVGTAQLVGSRPGDADREVSTSRRPA